MSVESISPYQLLTLAVSVIGSITVIFSVIFLYRQTRIFATQAEYLARSLAATVGENLNTHAHEISHLFVDHPTMRPYFYEGKTIASSHPDYLLAQAIAELMLDIFWMMRTTSQRYINTTIYLTPDGNQNLWQSYVEDSFAQSPILVETLMKHRAWYGQELFDQMNEGLKRRAAQTVETAV